MLYVILSDEKGNLVKVRVGFKWSERKSRLTYESFRFDYTEAAGMWLVFCGILIFHGTRLAFEISTSANVQNNDLRELSVSDRGKMCGAPWKNSVEMIRD